MSYTVLARRYRSETFDQVVGQEAVAKTLKNAIASKRVAHAYLFSGTRGVGKTSMARILAKALNCLNSDEPTPEPCLKCESCLAINEGEDIDVLEIDGASNTGVEHIRELRQNAIFKPARARFKVYIIDEVHMLSVSAFNALLKTLEEPPEHVKFIMATTEPNKVLATILSRCQRFDFRNIQPDDIVGHLQFVLKKEEIEAEEGLVRRVARLANGSMRDGLSLLDQLMSMAEGKLTLSLLEDLLGTPRSERIIELADMIAAQDIGGLLRQVDMAIGEGLALDQLAMALQDHFRDLMVMKNCGGDSELVEIIDETLRERMKTQAGQFDDAALVYYITVMEELRRAIRSSGSGRALLDAAMVRLTAAYRFSDTRALLEQVQQMRVGVAAGTRPAQPTPSAERATSSTLKSTTQADQTVSPPTASGSTFDIPSTLTLNFLQDNWITIQHELQKAGQKHLLMYLQPARPMALNDGTIELAMPADKAGIIQLLQDRPEQMQALEKALTSTLGRPIKLHYKTGFGSENGNGGGQAPANPDRPAFSPGSKPSQDEINDALNEPTVREVMQILGGKIRHIERMKDE